jgi:hypothetical protein
MPYPALEKYTAEQVNDLVEKIERVGGRNAVERFLRGELILCEAEMLKYGGRVELPKLPNFSAEETFLADRPPVRDHQLYGHFREYFAGVHDAHARPRVLKFYTLGKSATDKAISDRLGTVSLAHIWYLLCRQKKGQKGTLLIEGVNLFFVRHRGKTRTVWLSWVRNSGWKVVAESFQKTQWSAGVRVFSHR